MKLLIIGGTGGTGKELKTRCLQTRRKCWKLYYYKNDIKSRCGSFHVKPAKWCYLQCKAAGATY